MMKTIYTHTGWTQIDGQWVYLHGGGAIGAEGPVDGIEVELPDALRHFELPLPPSPDELPALIERELKLLDLGPDHVVVPSVATVFRAPLGDSDFSVHVEGQTGTFKTEEAALCQSHWGAKLNARTLPGSWDSTSNALELMAFHAKDAVFVVDDFKPKGTRNDVQRLHAAADRLFRAQGNSAGRARLTRETKIRGGKPPRGVIVSTGEEVPNGHSVRARLLVISVEAGTIRVDVLTACQRDAREGVYAQVMAAYLQWLAGRYAEIQARLESRRSELRDEAVGSHRRTPAIVADLMVGWETFLQFAAEVGGVSAEEIEELRRRGWAAFLEAVARHEVYLEDDTPVAVFFRLLAGALTAGKVHIADLDTCGVPEGRERLCGWARGGSEEAWHPQGDLIGWIKGDDLYLQPTATIAALRQVSTDTDRLAVSERTIGRELHAKGLLKSRDEGRKKFTTRARVGKKDRQDALHLEALRALAALAAPAAPDPLRDPEKADSGADFGAADGEHSGPTVAKSGPTRVMGPSPKTCPSCREAFWWRRAESAEWVCETCHEPAAHISDSQIVRWPVEDEGEAA